MSKTIWTKKDTINYFKNNETQELIIPEGVKKIKEGAFYACAIKKIIFPSSLNTIGNQAFMDCIYLKNIVFSNGLKLIGAFAFQGCLSLSEIKLPDSLEHLGWETFSDCSNLKTVYVNKNLDRLEIRAFNNCQSLKRVVLPEKSIEIGDNCFENCCNLTVIENSKYISKINERAFKNCKKLIDIDLSFCRYISSEAFMFCSYLKEINLRSTAYIGEKAFAFCTNLKKIDNLFVTGVIDSEAFMNCNNLTNIIVNGEEDIYIYKDIFKNCNNLLLNEYEGGLYLPNENNKYYALVDVKENLKTLVTHPNCKTIIPNTYSKNSNSIEKVVLNKGIETITECCFDQYINLKEIILPETIEFIMERA